MNARDEIQKRREGWEKTISSLAYQRLQKTREIEDLDRKISSLEGAILAAKTALADIDTEAAVTAAIAKSNETTP
jgi:chromosome segregation ATPase